MNPNELSQEKLKCEKPYLAKNVYKFSWMAAYYLSFKDSTMSKSWHLLLIEQNLTAPVRQQLQSSGGNPSTFRYYLKVNSDWVIFFLDQGGRCTTGAQKVTELCTVIARVSGLACTGIGRPLLCWMAAGRLVCTRYSTFSAWYLW